MQDSWGVTILLGLLVQLGISMTLSTLMGDSAPFRLTLLFQNYTGISECIIAFNNKIPQLYLDFSALQGSKQEKAPISEAVVPAVKYSEIQ